MSKMSILTGWYSEYKTWQMSKTRFYDFNAHINIFQFGFISGYIYGVLFVITGQDDHLVNKKCPIMGHVATFGLDFGTLSLGI